MTAVARVCLLICLLSGFGCGISKQYTGAKGDKKLLKTLITSPVFSGHHTGFALYNPASREWLCQYNAHRYFTPASNTKILTLLTSLHVLGDSIETLRYALRGDSLLFHGMADPSFLFSEISSSSRPFDVLKSHRGKLFYLPVEELDPYGPGWAWDDYPWSYQVEKSAFPMYGNRIRITRSSDDEFRVIPEYFLDYLQPDNTISSKATRDPVANIFAFHNENFTHEDTVEIPFIGSDYDIVRMLSDTLGREIETLYPDHFPEHSISVFGAARDTLLKRMMQESDNFIAEQLLMQCAFYMRGTFHSDSAIAVSRETIIRGSPDPFHWNDGSGLSRYNLFTPRSIVWLLEQIAHMMTMDYVTAIFPAGGKSGTIANWYAADPPFIFAKTGTLANQHCLSGFLRTDSGKWLIFSFMHNNFAGGSNRVKEEMQKLLFEIKERY